MEAKTREVWTKTSSKWRRWWATLGVVFGLTVGFGACDGGSTCDAGEEQYEEQNPGAGGYEEQEQGHSAGQTGQREKTLMIDEDAGDAEDPVPPDPGKLSR